MGGMGCRYKQSWFSSPLTSFKGVLNLTKRKVFTLPQTALLLYYSACGGVISTELPNRKCRGEDYVNSLLFPLWGKQVTSSEFAKLHIMKIMLNRNSWLIFLYHSISIVQMDGQKIVQRQWTITENPPSSTSEDKNTWKKDLIKVFKIGKLIFNVFNA